jgi:hypothetical protein
VALGERTLPLLLLLVPALALLAPPPLLRLTILSLHCGLVVLPLAT